MADEQQLGDDAPKSKKKLFIIIGAVVALLAIGGGAAFFLLGSDSSEGEGGEQEQAKEQLVIEPASYVNIGQPFLFSVPGKQRDRLVQIKVQIMVRGHEKEELARLHTPQLESAILETFATATVEQLRTPTGRLNLRDQATDNIKAKLTALIGEPVIEKVLFTDFVIQ